MDLSYIINELGEERDLYFNAIAPPIIQTSNFRFKTVDSLRQAFRDEMSAYLYSRGINPTVDILRKKLAALDGSEDALVFNSGASAIFAAVVSQVKAGDHIVSVRKPYTWAQKVFDQYLPRFGVSTTYVDGRLTDNFEQALRPETRVIYMESPNSWDYAIQDIPALVKLAKERDIVTIIDNSYCTPIYQDVIGMGVDMSLQSATKYIGGHSDVVAGVLTGTTKRLKKIFDLEYLAAGIGVTPWHAWLLIRGLRTLPIRLEHITRTTRTLLTFLKQHPRVGGVLFPLDPDFPQYELASRQMKGACGLLSFYLRAGSLQEVETFCEKLQHIQMAVSWGGHESLIIPKAAGIRPERFDAGNPEHCLIRLYVGLEQPEYLIRDLDQALG